MTIRAKNSGVQLSSQDATIIKAMLKRGDRQHDIAAWFGVNGGRIAEIANGDRFGSAKPATESELPPSRPYSSGQSAHAALAALGLAKEAIVKAEHFIR